MGLRRHGTYVVKRTDHVPSLRRSALEAGMHAAHVLAHGAGPAAHSATTILAVQGAAQRRRSGQRRDESPHRCVQHSVPAPRLRRTNRPLGSGRVPDVRIKGRVYCCMGPLQPRSVATSQFVQTCSLGGHGELAKGVAFFPGDRAAEGLHPVLCSYIIACSRAARAPRSCHQGRGPCSPSPPTL
jgi:hypothetical protein